MHGKQYRKLHVASGRLTMQTMCYQERALNVKSAVFVSLIQLRHIDDSENVQQRLKHRIN